MSRSESSGKPTTPSVLVVDDDALLRESICELVYDLGATVGEASNGDSAIRYLSDRDCDLLVSDVDMPDISGFELIARLQTLGQTPPVVLLSARADEAMAEAASRSGARHLFPKPVPTRAFRSAVCSILDL